MGCSKTQVNIACRKCIGCNQAVQRSWSVRCFHEAQSHTELFVAPGSQITTEIPNNCVITLTYDQEHIPLDSALDYSDFQRFLKRLRHHVKKPLSYFMCGEYGAKNFHTGVGRCHFHAIIFGWNPSDTYEVTLSDGQHQKMSTTLSDLWSQPPINNPSGPPSTIGLATVDTFTFAGAAYVAGYVAKKQALEGQHNGPLKTNIDAMGVTTILPIAPEFRHMSLNPAIGKKWITNPTNLLSVYEEDVVKISEWKFHPPKYYDKQLLLHRPDLVRDIMETRHRGMTRQAEEWTKDRCSTAELIALEALQQQRNSL